MNHTQSPGHSVTIEVNTCWGKAFAYLKDPLKLGLWAFGCRETQATDIEGVYVGTSLFNGEKTYFEIEAEEHFRIIDFLLGDLTSRWPRISLRIVPGPYYGGKDSTCLVTIDAWRERSMSDQRWHQLCVSHETEIFLIKSLLERET